MAMSMNFAGISSVLSRIDGRGYKAYRSLLGAREISDAVTVEVIKVQGDPYAPPSVVKLESKVDVPSWALEHTTPLSDFLCRRLYIQLRRESSRLGEGRSGILAVPKPGPMMLRRSCLEAHEDGSVVARIWVGLPSRGRRIDSSAASEMLSSKLPRAFSNSLDIGDAKDPLRRHIMAWRLQEYIREELARLGLVAFVGDGSILPRRCGGCWEPLEDAIPFESPRSLRVDIEVPWGDVVSGMGVRKGLTVIAGSAFHGKTTLAEAIAQGVWNHIPGDGREKVVAVRDAMLVRAEDGRYISCVDISSMIHDLPANKDTECFSTGNASGATSTAASVQEAVEAGSRLLVLDEDTAATNILYWDERVSQLIRWNTVTPLSELAKSMGEEGISLVVVSSGSLPLLSTANTVIVMEGYRARDATDEARRIAGRYHAEQHGNEYHAPTARLVISVPDLKKPKVKGRRLEDRFLHVPVDLDADELMVEEAQLATFQAIATRLLGALKISIVEYATRIEGDLNRGDFDSLLGREPGPGLAEVRAQDVAFLLNRLHGLRTIQRSHPYLGDGRKGS